MDPTGRRAHGTTISTVLSRAVLAAVMPIGIILALLTLRP
jgi:hypothetical protein